jgi:hypothetical protein
VIVAGVLPAARFTAGVPVVRHGRALAAAPEENHDFRPEFGDFPRNHGFSGLLFWP